MGLFRVNIPLSEVETSTSVQLCSCGGSQKTVRKVETQVAALHASLILYRLAIPGLLLPSLYARQQPA
ncbi:hypothetical protein TgHK011_005117 [Trichoderma gracile]|nr:hypothetical protein TgHK011_005117 [Trichoderma gracile]